MIFITKTNKKKLNDMKILTINELNEQKKQVKYRWREPYANVWHETRCEVLSFTDKTAKIKLLEFGKNGAPPGTILPKVHLDSLIGFENPNKPGPDLSWHKYTYFDK